MAVQLTGTYKVRAGHLQLKAREAHRLLKCSADITQWRSLGVRVHMCCLGKMLINDPAKPLKASTRSLLSLQISSEVAK